MILRSRSSPRRQAQPLASVPVASVMPVPGWLRRATSDTQSLASQGVADVALVAGAALGALDAVVRREERWVGAWRQRLALAGAAVTVRQSGRVEGEAALRDAVLLTPPGDDVGPAGRVLLAWRRLASRPPEELLVDAGIAGIFEAMGLVHDDETAGDLADELQQLAASGHAVGMLTGVFVATERHRLPRAVGSWLADVLLARRLGWTHAVPLLGGETAVGKRAGRGRFPADAASGSTEESDWMKMLLAAQACAALRAIDLAADLERRSERLLAVAPKLRAKAANAVVERLLSDDTIVASEKIAGMSDRGLRRLFDRLVGLGAVRELSGRPTFRIYGL